MLRVITSDPMYTRKYVEIACLSTDTKPDDGFVTGSVLIEVDMGHVYLYNEEGATGEKWVLVGGE